jgi:hypothetical protein
MVASACPHQHQVTLWNYISTSRRVLLCRPISIGDIRGYHSASSGLSARMVHALPMTALRSRADARGPYVTYPSLRPIALGPARSPHFSSLVQCPTYGRSDLTSSIQCSGFYDFTATMASGQDELDMEAFQRLSDTYQADVQVRSLIYQSSSCHV